MFQLDDTAIAEASLLHPIQTGYFTVATKHAPDSEGRTWSQKGYPMSSLGQVLSAVAGIPDYYISQASFVTPRRGNATVQAVSCSFVDLDCYKLGLVADDATVQAILDRAVFAGLPLPSYVMSSGRGLYAKWLFEQPISASMIPHWQKLQDVLGHLFMAFGSDANARDLARVLRASSTLNSKSGQTVRVIYQSGKSYRFTDLARTAASIGIEDFVQATAVQAKKIRIKQGLLETTPSDLGSLNEYAATREPVMMRQFSRQSLNWTRFLDLRDLMLMRGGAAKGSRDLLLFWMTAHLASAGVINPTNFWPEVQNLLRAFPISSDFNPAQDGSLQTLQKRIEMHHRGERVEYNGAKVSPIYTPSNDYLIDALCITDEEQRHLKTIISGQEKRRRSDLKCPGRQERRQAREEGRSIALQMQRQGLTVTAISERLGVHKSTISRWLTKGATQKDQVWDAQRIEQWLRKRKQSQQERNRQIELLRQQQEHIEAAKVAQIKLKTSVHLMAIYENITRAAVASKSAEKERRLTTHPLDPPGPQEHASAPICYTNREPLH